MNKHYDNLCAAAQHFGLEMQTERAQETLDELREALSFALYCMRQDGGLGSQMEAVIEEIADVYNLLDQLCILLDCEEAVQTAAERKMARTIWRYGIRV